MNRARLAARGQMPHNLKMLHPGIDPGDKMAGEPLPMRKEQGDAPKVIILSPFPPGGGKPAARGAALAHAFDAAGADVHTLDAPTTSFAAQHIHFAPKRRYRRESDAVLNAGWDIAVLAPAALDFRRIQAPSLYKRLAVGLRHIGLFWRLGWSARRVLVVRGGGHRPTRWAFWAVTLGLLMLRPHAVRITRAQDPAALAGRMLGTAPPLPSDEFGDDDTLLRLAGAGLRHSPAWLRRALGKAAPDIQTELSPILAACQHHARKAPAPFQTASKHRQSPHYPAPLGRVLDSADIPIGAFSLHLRSLNKAEKRFNTGTDLGRAHLLNWYVNQGPTLAGCAIPLPAQMLDAYRTLLIGDAPSMGLTADLQTHLTGIARRLGCEDDAARLACDFATLVFLSRFLIDLTAVLPEICARMAQPLPGKRLSVFQLMAATLARAPADGVEALDTPWDDAGIAHWFDSHVLPQAPALHIFARQPAAPATPALRITGPDSAESGLGRNAAMSARALDGISVNRPVALHHVNADAIPGQILRYGTGGDFNIGFLLWEAERVPFNHHFAAELLDDIWAPSHFVAELYKRAFDRPVRRIGKAIELPPVSPISREALGLRPENHLSLCIFDAHASVVRKNPLAALHGFQRAFAGDENARLIIKTTPRPDNHWGDPEGQMAQIAEAAARDRRIRLDTRFLPFAELLGLIACADCLISTHRGEGFGYIPAYAQALGTPVLATDYSGTQDFISDKTAWPLPWSPRAIRKGETIFPLQSGHWAESDVDALAEMLTTLRQNPEEAARRAAAGKALMAAEYSYAALRHRYRAALGELGLLTECSANVHDAGDERNRDHPTPRPRAVAGARRLPTSAQP